METQETKPTHQMTFDHWFSMLSQYAMRHNKPQLVDHLTKYSYKEYFDDGDTVEEAYVDLVTHSEYLSKGE